MPDVAHCRDLRRGAVGADVIAHKRAVSRWNPATYGWHEFTPLYGEFFETAVKAFQSRHRMTVDGVIGPATHTRLENTVNVHGDPVFDATAVKLAADYCREFGKTPEQRIREAIVAAGMFWYSHRATIAYSHVRPWPQGKPPFVPWGIDCSAYVTSCHYAGGAPDPNGRGFDRQGYTGTLLNHGRRAGAVGELEPGDLIFYGFSSGQPGFNRGDPTHVAMYVGAVAGVPSVLSNGHQPMGLYRWNYRSDVNTMRRYDVAAL